MVKNVGKAKKQIEARVTKGEVKSGFIFLDISNIYPAEKVQEFLQRTFENFHRNHAKLKEFQRFDQDAIDSVLEDRNFQQIIQSYMMHEAESALYSALPLRYKMGDATLGITFQVSTCFVVEDGNQYIPIPIRGMTYILNSGLSESIYKAAKAQIHSLAIGF